VLQLVNTPDIYKENKYQRRNLLLYHCLLDSGLRKFNVSQQVCSFYTSLYFYIDILMGIPFMIILIFFLLLVYPFLTELKYTE
jgi:hypothetical protein